MELISGTLIADRFRLEREIGRGGMGSVWRAHHVQLDVPCAIKFIEGEEGQRVELRDRFETEARAAAKLRSSHVVQILDHGVFQGLPYIAMELLEGEDLGARLRRLGKIHPKDCVVILSQVARALQRAHAARVIHRDLKPENVFLAREDDLEVVKILDFGIAKIAGPTSSGNTRTGSIIGTVHYMSPEQARGQKDIDYRTDLWSFAVIAFECLSGRKPFEGEFGELFVSILSSPLPSLAQAAPWLPPSIDLWWHKAASRDREQRYTSAQEAVLALSQQLGLSGSAFPVDATGAAMAVDDVSSAHLVGAASGRGGGSESGVGRGASVPVSQPIALAPTALPVASPPSGSVQTGRGTAVMAVPEGVTASGVGVSNTIQEYGPVHLPTSRSPWLFVGLGVAALVGLVGVGALLMGRDATTSTSAAGLASSSAQASSSVATSMSSSTAAESAAGPVSAPAAPSTQVPSPVATTTTGASIATTTTTATATTKGASKPMVTVTATAAGTATAKPGATTAKPSACKAYDPDTGICIKR